MSIFISKIIFGTAQTIIFNSIIAINFMMLRITFFRKHKHVNILINIFLSFCYQYFYSPSYDISDENDLIACMFFFIIRMGYVSDSFTGNWYESFAYIYFVPGFAVGPVVLLKDFVRLVNRVGNSKIKIVLKNNKKKDIEIKDENKSQNTFKRTSLMNVFSLFFGLFTVFAIKPFNIDEEIYGKHSLSKKLFYMFCFAYRKKGILYFVWSFASLCYAICGIEAYNVDFMKIESATSFKFHPKNWNISAYVFYRQFFYENAIFFLDNLGVRNNKKFAVYFTFLCSAAMHSIKACELVFFGTFGISTKLLDIFIESIPFIRNFSLLKFMIIHLYSAFLILIKDCSTFSEIFNMWKQVYFSGFAILISLGIISYICKFIKKIK